ncbi:MAG: hypothetical protein A6F71_04975 [Cycloclasticus sp. symbiont of Poecilosclerida sp. M]|nr:MAG: hypothetical protein A6F71_04975 [Cycloclasticus sp. symbiont of Poecilosclerida sp. M]
MAGKLSSLLANYGLTKRDISKKISAKYILAISRSSCTKWRSLPAYLEMDTIVAKDIDRFGSALDEIEKREKFLNEWQEQKGDEATYKSLICALLELECRQDAEFVCKQLTKDAASTTPTPTQHASGSSNTGKLGVCGSSFKPDWCTL